MNIIKAIAAIFILSLSLHAQGADPIAAKTAGMKKIDGYVPIYWDTNSGKMFMEVSRLKQEFLYVVSLPAGVGSNPIGLDRGQLGRSFVVHFERVGPKVMLVQPNYRYRAITDDEAEKRAVADSFARSVIWGFKVEAESEGRILVDATQFLLRDAHQVSERLRQSRQGNYRADESRSTFFLERTKGFPKNTEVETIITLAGDEPGRLVSSVTPTPNSLTVRQHHSFVELPDANYKPRMFDPRTSSMPVTFADYASRFTTPIEKRWIMRHRLEKKDPSAAVSEPVQPIVYYVDNGVPEPIRSALVEGAAWWNQAFEAAGYKDAFIVKVLPPDADPMDIRYNMINWVHRSTRGWSYGAAVTDPRTGEIIKGNVSLGSLRIRQDFLLGTGMIPSYPAGACMFGESPELTYLVDSPEASEKMSLARIRQLSAHEVGHTIGFSHNFAASTYDRGSVMDYPAPWVDIKDGKLDLSNAYAVGIGSFDKFSVKYAYSHFPAAADENAELEKILQKGIADGMLYIDDEDGRGIGTGHPLASIWDNGSDAVETLRHEMKVRRIGLDGFGLQSVPDGTPLSELEAKLIPLYLHHRFQVAAAMKPIGGVYFTYAVRVGGKPSPSKFREIVAPARQREALSAVLDTITPKELAFPSRILEIIPPRATGFEAGPTEYFASRTGQGLDSIGAATMAADLVVTGLLDPSRAARMIEFNAQDKKYPHFSETVEALVGRTWNTKLPVDGYHAQIATAVRLLVVEKLMDLAANSDASGLVRAVANDALVKLSSRLKADLRVNPNGVNRMVQQDIERFLSRPDAPRVKPQQLPIPAGEPIGN